jgi:hypothetical protein
MLDETEFVGEVIKQRPFTIICGKFNLVVEEGIQPAGVAALLNGLARAIVSHLNEQPEF